MNFYNAPPSIMHTLAHPDAPKNIHSGSFAGRPDRAHWFAYWASMGRRNASAQEGTGLRALKAWAANLLTPGRARAKKSEAVPSPGFPRELDAIRDC
jgi:hypothetical protein